MSKVTISSTKYVILGEFETEGYIDKPDLIGAFFGQTEGLIGDELEFQNLQKTGKIGRIEIELKKNNSKTKGTFSIPTALDKVEVSLVGAAIESITKIGHTNGSIKIKEIKDQREEKRIEILKRAEDLLKNLKQTLPTSIQLEEDIAKNIANKSIKKYDKEYFGGPNLEQQKEIILVEGRADVLNLLSCGIDNVLCFNGSGKVSKFIINLCSKKNITLFLDGDRAAQKEAQVLKEKIHIDSIIFAPQGTEVEELSYKEVIKSLKNRKFLDTEEQKEIETSVISKIKNIIFDKNAQQLKLKQKVENLGIKEEINEETKTEEKTSNNIKKNSEYLTKKQYDKIDIIIKEVVKNKNYLILNKDYKTIHKSDLTQLSKVELKDPKILIFDGVCENMIYNLAKKLGIKLIVCRKKSKLKEDQTTKIKLFEEFTNS